MGEVYRARDIRLNRDVALKFLPPDLTHDASARERFMVEARAASALDHANICTIYDIDETEDGDLFIAMAFYAGRTLKARLAEGPLTIQQTAEIGSGVARGLARAHEAGIVHRDIKPANLMLTDRGEVKILDFGVAKLLGKSDLTRTGATLGTLGYMSPEQLEAGAVGPATDLWSLGVVLYEGLVGQSPFAAESQSNLIAAILTKTPPEIRSLRPDIPEPMSELIEGLLDKDPARRPTPAGAVAEGLGALVRPSGEAPARGWSRRAAWLTAAGALVALILTLVIPSQRRARMEDARARLQEAESLLEQRRFAEAYAVALEVESVLGSDSLFEAVMDLASDRLTVLTDPRARLSVETYEAGRPVPVPDDLAPLLARSPVVDVRIPRGDHRIVMEAEGHESVERLVSSALLRAEGANFGLPWALLVEESLPPVDVGEPGMVHVPGGSYQLVSADAPVDASADLIPFLVDRFETTNEAFAEFVRDGGYGDPDLWPESFQDGPSGATGRGEALARLVDRTALPGPRDWSGQRFPDGQERHPVTGITWYEARAYCAWRGASLPTLFEWEMAARDGAITHKNGLVFPWGFVEAGSEHGFRANFGGSGTTPVDAHPLGMSPYGAYDMAGNVREFTATRAETGVIAMGGSWRDRSYQFVSIATPLPMFAADDLGFRCVRRSEPDAEQGAQVLALERRSPTYEPVDVATYRSFLTHYRYDPVEPEPAILSQSETDDWSHQLVRFNGVDGASILAHVYLPKSASPPYQTMVFVASGGAFLGDPVDNQLEWTLGPTIRAGRAAVGVVLEGMVERPWPDGPEFPASNTVEFRELMVRHATELSLTLDYLETRDDIDEAKVAYVGLSWGAGSRATLAAVDDRWGAVIFLGAGIDERIHPVVPEALNVNFIPYIRAPKLMVNGRQDEEHPWLTRAQPFWELLREPKELVLADDEGHNPSLETRIPAINGFLDRVFGPVR